MMYILAIAIMFAAGAARADPCAFFDIKVSKKYNIRPSPNALIRATRTYPLDGDQCVNNNNTEGCCLTDNKYMSIHTEILENTKPERGETKESLYVATFASPAKIAKYTTVYNFTIVSVTPRKFRYTICYKSIDPRSGTVSPRFLIVKDHVKDIKGNDRDDGTSLIGKRCEICPRKSSLVEVTSPNNTYCGPAFMWDPFSKRQPKTTDCYPMVSPSLLAIHPVCPDAGSNVTFVQRFRSYACQETSDTGYRVSGKVTLKGITAVADTCYVGTGQ
jgi:hypothetical protein